MTMQPPRSYPYFGYLLFVVYCLFVVLNITFLVIYANRAMLAYQVHNYAETVFLLCMGTLAAIAFRFLLQFGRFAFFRQPTLEV